MYDNINLQKELTDLNNAARLSKNDLIKIKEIKELILQTENKIIENQKLSTEYKKELDEINPHGIINCDNVNSFILTDITNRNRKKIFEKLKIHNFYDNFDIVDLHNNPIIIPDLIIPKLSDSYQEDSYQKESNLKILSLGPVPGTIKKCVTEILNKDMERTGWLLDNKIEYCKYNRKYRNKDFDVKIFGIKIKNKSKIIEEPEIIIAQIMDFKIIIDNEIIREGKTIINFIDESIQINKYGLYSNYYVENEINNEYTELYDMVSKPLEYKDQCVYIYIISDYFDKISCGLFNNLKIFNIGKLINNKTITYENWTTITIKEILNKDTSPNYYKMKIIKNYLVS